jgi:hypothetical protein
VHLREAAEAGNAGERDESLAEDVELRLRRAQQWRYSRRRRHRQHSVNAQHFVQVPPDPRAQIIRFRHLPMHSPTDAIPS